MPPRKKRLTPPPPPLPPEKTRIFQVETKQYIPVTQKHGLFLAGGRLYRFHGAAFSRDAARGIRRGLRLRNHDEADPLWALPR